jgi:hypothetical protein
MRSLLAIGLLLVDELYVLDVPVAGSAAPHVNRHEG